MHWPRAFHVHWRMGGLLADGAPVLVRSATCIAMSRDTLPWTSAFQICWTGLLVGLQVGLTDAPNIDACIDSQMAPPTGTRHTTLACGLRLRSDRPPAWPRWTLGTLTVGNHHAPNVSDLVRDHHRGGTICHELCVGLRWNHTDFVLELNNTPVASLHLEARDGLPHLRGHSRLFLKLFWARENMLSFLKVCPLDVVADSHLRAGRPFPVPCERCLPAGNHQGIAVCSSCNAGYCENHGGRCGGCDLQVCAGCEGRHLPVTQDPRPKVVYISGKHSPGSSVLASPDLIRCIALGWSCVACRLV